jgi:hypothetical protein
MIGKSGSQILSHIQAGMYYLAADALTYIPGNERILAFISTKAVINNDESSVAMEPNRWRNLGRQPLESHFKIPFNRKTRNLTI